MPFAYVPDMYQSGTWTCRGRPRAGRRVARPAWYRYARDLYREIEVVHKSGLLTTKHYISGLCRPGLILIPAGGLIPLREGDREWGKCRTLSRVSHWRGARYTSRLFPVKCYTVTPILPPP